METANLLEPGDGWEIPGGEWSRPKSLLDLIRREYQTEQLSPERLEQIRERVLERLERNEARRRKVCALGWLRPRRCWLGWCSRY